MKRDWDLLCWILNEVESADRAYPTVLTVGVYTSEHYALDLDQRDFREVCEHIRLLRDSGLAEVRDLGGAGVAIDRLTMTGHDFLDAARDETVWRKTMNVVKEKGGGVTVGVITQILTALVKQKFGLS